MRALLFLLLTICTTAMLAAPATAFRVTLPATAVTYHPFNFTVEAIDGSGTVDPTYTGTILFTAPGNFGATLPPTYTFTPGDAGVHVFSATLTAYGDDRPITVTDANNATITGTGTTNVRYGPGATQRLVITAPDTGNLGEPFDVTITATDIDGNPTGADYTGTVRITMHGVTLPSSYTFTPADAGSKTFSATPTRGGHVGFGAQDLTYPGILDSHSMVIACPGFTVTASNDSPVCPNAHPTLTAHPSQPGATFDWQGPRFWQAQGQVVQGTTNYEGTYSVLMSAPNGCTAFATTDVTLNSTMPNVQAVDNPNWVCDTFEKTFTIFDQAENGPYTNIVWTLDMSSSGTIVSGQGTPTVTVRGEYNPMMAPHQGIRLYLSATNGEGCVFVNHSAAHVEVYQRPTGTIQTVANACPGTTYSATPQVDPLAGVSFPLFTYNWSIENGTITETSVDSGKILYNVSGEGDAILTLTINSPHCSYTTTKTVTAGGPSASIASAEHNICAGEEVQIPVTLSGQAPFTIGWSDGTLQSGVTSSFTRTVTPTDTTHYSIVSVSDANCSNGSATGSVDVTTRTSAVITQQPKDTTVPRGQRATLTVDVEPDATAIQWYRGLPGDTSNPIDGANSLELTTPPITQNTTFWVEIETSCGTQASNAATVKVESRRRAVRHP